MNEDMNWNIKKEKKNPYLMKIPSTEAVDEIWRFK